MECLEIVAPKTLYYSRHFSRAGVSGTLLEVIMKVEFAT